MRIKNNQFDFNGKIERSIIFINYKGGNYQWKYKHYNFS